jgi:hypothetical protein
VMAHLAAWGNSDSGGAIATPCFRQEKFGPSFTGGTSVAG